MVIANIARERPIRVQGGSYAREVLCWPPLRVVMRAPRPALVDRIRAIFSGQGPPADVNGRGSWASGRLTYEIEELGGANTPRYLVTANGELLFQSESDEGLVRCLEGTITHRLTRSLTHYHLFHAGAVARNGRGVLLPGASGAGKSTMVGALALAGFDYCSDEVAVVGPDLRLRPFPRVISLKSGGWHRLQADFPDACERQLVFGSSAANNWFLKPEQVPSEEQSREGHEVSFILLPNAAQPGRGVLQRLPKSDAVTRMVEQSMDLALRGAKGLNVIVDLVRRAECYALDTTDLRRAVGEVKRLTA